MGAVSALSNGKKLLNDWSREKILTFVDVPMSGGDEKKWLQAGTVLFLKSQF